MGVMWYVSTGIQRSVSDRCLVSPCDIRLIADIPGKPQPHWSVGTGLEDEPLTIDVAGHHVGVPVVVGEQGTVFAPVGIPPDHPVQVPGQHVRAVTKALVLGVGADDPPPILDAFVHAATGSGHLGRRGSHAASVDDARPGDVGKEA
jgi:hypothetical protein